MFTGIATILRTLLIPFLILVAGWFLFSTAMSELRNRDQQILAATKQLAQAQADAAIINEANKSVQAALNASMESLLLAQERQEANRLRDEEVNQKLTYTANKLANDSGRLTPIRAKRAQLYLNLVNKDTACFIQHVGQPGTCTLGNWSDQ